MKGESDAVTSLSAPVMPLKMRNEVHGRCDQSHAKGVPLPFSRADDDVVDGNVNEFDEEANESHDGEADGRCHGDLDELLPVWLGASLHQTHRILGEVTHRLQLQQEGIHDEEDGGFVTKWGVVNLDRRLVRRCVK